MNVFQRIIDSAYGLFGFHNETVVAVVVDDDNSDNHQYNNNNKKLNYQKKQDINMINNKKFDNSNDLMRKDSDVIVGQKFNEKVEIIEDSDSDKIIKNNIKNIVSGEDNNGNSDDVNIKNVNELKNQGSGEILIKSGNIISNTIISLENFRLLNISKSFISGGIAGAIAKTVVAPLERTKIIFQTSQARFTLMGVGTELITIIQNEGYRALWRGHVASLARVIPYSAIQLTSYDLIKGFLLKPGESDLSPGLRVSAGGLAGGISVICTYPLDLVRARMAVQRDAFLVRGALRNSLGEVIKTEGVHGLYKGLLPTMIGIVPYSGLAFGIFETLKLLVKNHRYEKKEISSTDKMLCGAVSGFIAQSITYPIDVIRRRMQTDGLVKGIPTYALRHDVTNSGKKRYESMNLTIQYVYETEGIRGFFKGVSLNWIKGPIAVAVSFTVYDKMKEIFHVEPVRHGR